jgi:hypothetical protein
MTASQHLLMFISLSLNVLTFIVVIAALYFKGVHDGQRSVGYIANGRCLQKIDYDAATNIRHDDSRGYFGASIIAKHM